MTYNFHDQNSKNSKKNVKIKKTFKYLKELNNPACSQNIWAGLPLSFDNEKCSELKSLEGVSGPLLRRLQQFFISNLRRFEETF